MLLGTFETYPVVMLLCLFGYIEAVPASPPPSPTRSLVCSPFSGRLIDLRGASFSWNDQSRPSRPRFLLVATGTPRLPRFVAAATIGGGSAR